MQQYLTQLSHCPLFSRLSESDILFVLRMLSAKVLRYEKEALILHQGMPCKSFGIVLEGSAHIIAGDASGNHTLVSTLNPNHLFAEAFAFSGTSVLPISVIAAQDCTVLLLDHSRVASGHQAAFPSHAILIANLLRIISTNNLHLVQKISVISQRTTRDKLMAYLITQRTLAGSSRFTIPLNRQELADYLCVERSAMSAEISKMKKAGLIACHKNEFEILSPERQERSPVSPA